MGEDQVARSTCIFSRPERVAGLGGITLARADIVKLIADEPEKVGQGDPGSQHQAGVIIGNTPDIA